MEAFLPTEIARLVYGYLEEENCAEAAQAFLGTSKHMEECLLVSKKGRRFHTKVMGRNLVDLLDLLSEVICIVQTEVKNDQRPSEEFIEKLARLLGIQDCDGLSPSGSNTVYLSISVPSHSQTVNKRKPPPRTPENPAEANVERRASTPKPNLDKSKELDDDFLEKLLENTLLHERIAENINKVMHTKETSKNDEVNIRTILTNTEADPIFEEVVCDLAAPRMEDSTTPEDTEHECREVDRPESDATKELIDKELDLERQNNEAVLGIIANNRNLQKKKQEEERSVPVTPRQAEPLPTGNSMELDQLLLSPPNPPQPAVIEAPPPPTQFTLLQILPATNAVLPSVSSPSLPPVLVLPRTLQPIKPKPAPVAPKTIFTLDSTPMPESKNVAILPKPDESSPSFKKSTEKALLKEDSGKKIKRTGVRTRGGLRKTRGANKSSILRSILPQVKQVDEDKLEVEMVDLVPEEEGAKQDPPPPASNEVATKETESKAEPPTPSEDTPKQRVERKVKKQSLSTPRRGSHVRALEFRTPMKALPLRRANTSPKAVSTQRLANFHKSIKRVCRGSLFKSPPGGDKKKDKTAWDADLRAFAKEPVAQSSGEAKKRLSLSTRKSKRTLSARLKDSTPKRIEHESEPEPEAPCDDLVKIIEKEVLDVIGEEEEVEEPTPPLEIQTPFKTPGKTASKSKKDVLQTPAKEPEEIINKEVEGTPLSKVLKELPSGMRTTSGKAVEDTPVTKILKEHSANLSKPLVTPSLPETPQSKTVEKTPEDPVEARRLKAIEETPVSKILREHSAYLANPLITPGFTKTPEASTSKSDNKTPEEPTKNHRRSSSSKDQSAFPKIELKRTPEKGHQEEDIINKLLKNAHESLFGSATKTKPKSIKKKKKRKDSPKQEELGEQTTIMSDSDSDLEAFPIERLSPSEPSTSKQSKQSVEPVSLKARTSRIPAPQPNTPKSNSAYLKNYRQTVNVASEESGGIITRVFQVSDFINLLDIREKHPPHSSSRKFSYKRDERGRAPPRRSEPSKYNSRKDKHRRRSRSRSRSRSREDKHKRHRRDHSPEEKRRKIRHEDSNHVGQERERRQETPKDGPILKYLRRSERKSTSTKEKGSNSTLIKSVSSEKSKRLGDEKEDGEISDSSNSGTPCRNALAAPKKSAGGANSLLGNLKGEKLERFLTIIHGQEK